MADRTSAGLFGKIFELLAKNPTDEHKAMAKEIFPLTRNYDFSNYQMDADESLLTLGPGHREKYWTEAAELYREEGIKEELKANNEAHKSATRTLVKEAVKLARGQQIHKRTSGNFINKNPFYTESEILEKLKL